MTEPAIALQRHARWPRMTVEVAMLLSVVEAAQLLGVSARTVRSRLSKGQLVGRKKGGQWVVPRDGLPLPASEHRRLHERAEAIRQTVDAALPSRTTSQRKRRSVVDEVTYRAAHGLRAELLASDHSAAAATAARHLTEGLEALAVALHEWQVSPRIEALTKTRAAVARAVAALLLDGPLPPVDPVRGWVAALELEVLAPLAGLFRQAERRGRAPR